MGDSVLDKSVYRSFLTLLSTRVKLVDKVELDLLDFDVIFD